ncbi:MAG: SUMF1/EgtB/PvdO family nonheme iron enzyme [Planctomycetes bacterium]|nr:SUMF1/EgtB/PvdO family nonheme iron enzyme [Planctomycetota bacterium]
MAEFSQSIGARFRVVVVQGDIADRPCGAVICAANDQLMMGGGVAGALRIRGGDAIEREAEAHAPAPLGSVIRTAGHELLAEYVYHAVVIRYDLKGGSGAADVLVAYREVLSQVDRDGVLDIAIPLLGAGVGGLGAKQSTELLLEAIEGRDARGRDVYIQIVSIDEEDVEAARTVVSGYQPPTVREAALGRDAEAYMAQWAQARLEAEQSVEEVELDPSASPDQRLRLLARTAEPGNSSWNRYARELKRAQGDEALELLNDREAWQGAGTQDQDAAIVTAQELLGEDWRLEAVGTFECAGTSHRIPIFRHLSTRLQFHLVPGGTYTMGSADFAREEAFCQPQEDRTRPDYFRRAWLVGEFPGHEIYVPPMLVQRTVLTYGEYTSIGRPLSFERAWLESVHSPVLDGDPFPAFDPLVCIEWAATLPGSLRPPSEAEWEYLARAGSQTRFYWGDEMDPAYCWFNKNSTWIARDQNGEGGTSGLHGVEEHADQANSFGLIDTLGHVEEIVSDGFFPDEEEDGYRVGPFDASPLHPSASARITRGGSFDMSAGCCRSAHRGRNVVGQLSLLGIRLVGGVPWTVGN